MDPFVCYRIVINEGQSRRMNRKVKEGDDIDSIIDGIKLKNSVLLASVSVSSIELFESIESAEPLDSFTPWNSNVAWGKPETPLVVRVRPLAVAPWNNSEMLEFYKPALEFAKQQLEAKTEHRAMSKATDEFARRLLSGMNINIKVDAPNTDAGSIAVLSPYVWTVETNKNEIVKKGEPQGTADTAKWLHENFLKGSIFGLKVVTDKDLPELKANKMSTRGRGDLVIGIKEHLEVPAINPYTQAFGLIETDEYDFNPAQNVLELTALAKISRLGKNVALLGSDCDKKWELYYFKDNGTIMQRGYLHGGKCWDDFKTLLDEAETKELEPPTSRFKPTLPDYEEENTDDQNLDGFDVVEDSKYKAVERQAMLENLANQLAERYGERPIVPIWARAEATCPEYYSESTESQHG